RIIDAPALVRAGFASFTAYPIAIGERVLGAFAVHRTTSWAATPETASLMGSLAAQAAVALENARLYSETTRRLAQTRALLEVAEILNSTLDARQLLKRLAIKVAQVCGVDRCSIERWEGDRVVPLMSQFAPWQVDLASAVVGQIALALENTRLYAEAQERLRETTTLLAVGRVLSQPDAGGDVMRRVAAEVARAFGADMVGAYLLADRKE